MDASQGKGKAASSDQLPLIEISDEDEDAELHELELDPTSLEKCNACGSSVSHHHISNGSLLCQKIMIMFQVVPQQPTVTCGAFRFLS